MAKIFTMKNGRILRTKDGRLVREGAAIPVPVEQQKERIKHTLELRARKVRDAMMRQRELGITYKGHKDIFSLSIDTLVVDDDNQFAPVLRVTSPKQMYGTAVYCVTIAPKDAVKRIPTRNGILVALHKALCHMPYEGVYTTACGRYKFDFNKLNTEALKVAVEYLKQSNTTNKRAWLAPLIDLMITLEAETIKISKTKKGKYGKYDKGGEPIAKAAIHPANDDDYMGDEPPEPENWMPEQLTQGRVAEVLQSMAIGRGKSRITKAITQDGPRYYTTNANPFTGF